MTGSAPRPDDADEPVGAHRGADRSEDRAATIARLAAAIGRVGPDGQVAAPDPSDPTPGAGASGRGGSQQVADRGREAAAGPTDAAPRARSSGRGRARQTTDQDPVAAARNICLRLLTVQARSRAELADALRRREIPDDAAAQALDRLTELGLIDDAAFARAFVATKQRSRGLSRAALRNELRKKGVAPEDADPVLAAVDDADERARAAALVAKKLDAAVFSGLTAARRRLLSMLSRRGYPASIAIPVVNRALDGYVEPIDDPGDGPV